jgi:hypothetical protein
MIARCPSERWRRSPQQAASILVYTPGVTNTLYNGGENSYGLEPGFLLVDQGTAQRRIHTAYWASGGNGDGLHSWGRGDDPSRPRTGALASLTVKVQAHATQGVGIGSSACIGSSGAKNAMYMDYLSLNGNYYGTGASSGPTTRR